MKLSFRNEWAKKTLWDKKKTKRICHQWNYPKRMAKKEPRNVEDKDQGKKKYG